MLSGMSDMKSQKLSWAVCACGKPRLGSCLAAWIKSGNLIASCMKNTGMLLPTMSQLPSLVVKLHGEAAHVSREIGRSFVAGYGREPDERWCLLSWPLKQVGARKLDQRLVVLEITVCAEASSMNNAFRNAFMIEVKNLFPKVGVFHRGRPARPNSERILVVGNRRSLLSGQRRDVISRDLVKFTAGSVARFLVIQFRGLGLAID